MSLLIKTAEEHQGLTKEDRKKAIVKQMIESGRQVPLSFLVSKSEILRMEIKAHVKTRYKQRFRNAYDIEIENMIRADLCSDAMIVDNADSGRFKVKTRNLIIIMDENIAFTTYDASGADRNNNLDPKAAILKSSRYNRQNHIENLFAQIQK